MIFYLSWVCLLFVTPGFLEVDIGSECSSGFVKGREEVLLLLGEVQVCLGRPGKLGAQVCLSRL